jgi:hypothetical protein
MLGMRKNGWFQIDLNSKYLFCSLRLPMAAAGFFVLSAYFIQLLLNFNPDGSKINCRQGLG